MTYSIFVWDFAPDTTMDNILAFFVYCGKVEKHTELSLEKDGKITKVIQLEFADQSAIELARLLHGAPLEDTPISVSDSFVYSSFFRNNHIPIFLFSQKSWES